MPIGTFGAIAYGMASGSFLLLSLLLLTSWEGRAQGVRLIVASAMTSLWAALLAYESWTNSVAVAAISLAEFLRDGAWLLVLTGLTHNQGFGDKLSRVSLLASAGAVLIAALQLFDGPMHLESSSQLGLLVLGGLALSLVAMVLLEQLYRNANAAGRFALKFLVIGVGGLFAYDLFLYSQAQLLKAIEPASWAARGLVVTLTVPAIALAARYNPQWSLNVFVSRHVVFYTTSFLVVGAYLLVMAAGGYAIRLYGGTWGRIAQLVFFAGAGMVLLVLMTSANLRRRLRVFLSKHFYRNKYDYRVEWLRFIDTLSRRDAAADVRSNAVRSIAQIIGSPGGVLFLAGDRESDFAPVAAWPATEFDRSRYPAVDADDDLPRFLRHKQWVVDLRECALTPDLYQNLVLPPELPADIRLRLVVPLVLGEELLGFIVLADPPPPFDTTYEDRDLLKTAGRDVAMHLAQHEADRQLAESRQFETYHRLTAFVMHDLKNLAAQLAMVVTNAEKHRRNPEFVDDAISTVANSSARMQRLIEQLQGREVATAMRRISLAQVARDACERCAIRRPVPTCGALDPDAVVHADPERLGRVIEHLIRNAQDATPAGGTVRIDVVLEREAEMDALGASGVFAVMPADYAASAPVAPGGANGGDAAADQARSDVASLTVTDTGSGMTAEFVKERLFRPFDTTKGSKGMGIGAYQVREYVRAVGGRIRVRSVLGRGTEITLRLPARP